MVNRNVVIAAAGAVVLGIVIGYAMFSPSTRATFTSPGGYNPPVPGGYNPPMPNGTNPPPTGGTGR